MSKDYASLGEFNTALNSAINGLNAEIGTMLKPLSSELASKIKVRVMSTGKSSEGRSFSPYAPRSIKRKQRSGVGIYGKEIKFKNFTWRDTMWKNFNFKSVTVAADLIKAQIGFSGNHPFDGKSYNEIHDEQSYIENTDISAPNTKEEEELVNGIAISIGQYFERILG